MMEWFRSYTGTTADPKFRVVAKKSSARLGDVLAVWQMLLERACAAEERGSVEGFDCEGADALLDLDDGQGCAILEAMKAKGLVRQGRIANWEKRQPKREDGSAERARAWREQKKAEANANERTRTQTNARLEESREDLKNKNARGTHNPEEPKAESLPSSPEDDPDVQPRAEISSLNDCAIEFQDLAGVYQQAGGCVDVVPAYKAYEAMRRNFPLARIVDDLGARSQSAAWRRQDIPTKLSTYLGRKMWLDPIPTARASPNGTKLGQDGEPEWLRYAGSCVKETKQ